MNEKYENRTRGWGNFCLMRTFLFLLGIFLSGAFQSKLFAKDVSTAETQFLVGYQAYLEKNYAVCADEFYFSVQNESSVQQRAQLLLAHCQERLGLKLAAAYNIDALKGAKFTADDHQLYQSLKAKLKKEI